MRKRFFIEQTDSWIIADHRVQRQGTRIEPGLELVDQNSKMQCGEQCSAISDAATCFALPRNPS